MRIFTFGHDLKFSLFSVCRFCGYIITSSKSLSYESVINSLDDFPICTNPDCPSDILRFPSFSASHPKLPSPFSANCFRIFTNGHLLRDAFDNPSSSNICHCPTSPFVNPEFTLLSGSVLHPFICSECSHLWLLPYVVMSQRCPYGFLRSMVIAWVINETGRFDIHKLIEN